MGEVSIRWCYDDRGGAGRLELFAVLGICKKREFAFHGGLDRTYAIDYYATVTGNFTAEFRSDLIQS